MQGDTSESNTKPKIKSLIRTCWAYPAQWECKTEDGKYVYIRYRHNYLFVGIGNTMDEAVANAMSDSSIGFSLDDKESSGEMDVDEMQQLTGDILDWVDSPDETY